MLDSWNGGAAKTALLEFVESVTTQGDSLVPPEGRVAVFDNDGTLWCEKPRYVQAEFLMRRRGQDSEEDQQTRENRSGSPSSARRRTRLAEVLDSAPDLISGLGDAARGITAEAFEGLVREFLDAATHPVLGVPYTQLAYHPMLELPIAEGPGKPVHIWKRTGRKPLFACGNADGDREMLQIARFPLLIHHDDADREFAYDEKAEKVLGDARARGWTVVSMKSDFRRVF